MLRLQISRLAKEKLMKSAQKLFAKVYEQAQGAQAGRPGMAPGPDMQTHGAGTDKPDDDVVDGDYKEV